MKKLTLSLLAIMISGTLTFAQDIRFSISQGLITPTSRTADSLNFNSQNTYNGSLYVRFGPRESSGLATGRRSNFSFGINMSGGIITEQAPSTSNYLPFSIAGETTPPNMVAHFSETKTKRGYNFQVSPQLNFELGNFEFSPMVGFGYLKTIQKAYTIEQSISTTPYPTYAKIYGRPESVNSGFTISPKFRVSYRPGIVGLWVEGDYVAGPEMTSRSLRLLPNGRPGTDGVYKPDQILTGTAQETIRKSRYGAFGIHVGVSIALTKKKKGKPVYQGHDDDCDGLAIVTDDISIENGGMVQRIVKRRIVPNDGRLNTASNNEKGDNTTRPSTTGNVASGIPANMPQDQMSKLSTIKNNPLYSSNSGGTNPLAEKNSTTSPTSCGPVSQIIIRPDGSTEELFFACPDDAIYYNERKSNSNNTPKQTQGSTFGEKVNAGLHAAGGAIASGSSIIGASLPGGAVISARGMDNSMPNRISMNVTVAKQTQGATFGERTATAANTIHISLIDEGCIVFMPDNTTIRVNTQKQSATEISESESNNWKGKLAARQATLSNQQTLQGGSLPGGSIISAAVSAVSSTSSVGGGASSAAYAATGRAATPSSQSSVTQIPDNDCDTLLPLSDNDYELTFIVVDKATSGLKDTLKTQVRIGFTVENSRLKTKHDTAKNSVSNIR